MSIKSATTTGTLIALLSAFTAGSEALTLSAASNLSPGTLFRDTTVSGVFDITPHLPSGDYFPPYAITASSIYFYFADDADDPQYTGSTSTPYSFGGYSYYRTETRYFSDPAEAVTLEAGPLKLSGATSYYAANASGGTYQSDSFWQHSGYLDTYSYTCWFFFTCYDERWVDTSHYVPAYTTIVNTTSGYGGALSVGDVLDVTVIGDLSEDGLLPFTLTFSGDLSLVSASLSVEVLENRPPIVPVPAAVWLLGSALGLLGLGFCRSRAQ